MNDLLLPAPTGFSLRAASAFYEGFLPGSGMAAASTDRLTLAFRLDRTFEAVAVELTEDAHGVVARFVGTQHGDLVGAQVGRMLGLHEGEGWLDVGRRDPRLGALQASFPGFFTAAKASPYDAAAWGVIVPRMNMRAAAKVKTAIAEEFGERVRLAGRTHVVFPAPHVLERIEQVPGLPGEKLLRLRAVAQAALEGRLDAERLRRMDPDAALADLQSIRGVGPWTAGHVYYRGAAPTDGLPLTEPRVLHGFASWWGAEALAETDTQGRSRRAEGAGAAFLEASERWRPYRMWVCILLSRHLHRTGEWSNPALPAERKAAGRRASAPRVTRHIAAPGRV